MNAKQVAALVRAQIDGAWQTSNLHRVNLKVSLVEPPRLITVIDRRVVRGKIVDQMVNAWLVLEEHPGAAAGYRIVCTEDGSRFGLAVEGFPADRHLVLCGWYGDFMTTFLGM